MLSAIRHFLGLAPAGAAIRVPRGPFDDLRDQIRRDVANGFLDEEAILANARDLIEDYADEMEPEQVRHEARRLLYEALADQLDTEQGWVASTDCDRLDAAFAALDADGVIARQNFSCCGSCGSSEIWDEVRGAQAQGRSTRGYAFFHMQDTEGAVEGHGLYLNYGACGQGEAAAVKIGHDIVARLAEQGLRTHWDGTLGKRIGVSVDWKKRRPRPPVAN